MSTLAQRPTGVASHRRVAILAAVCFLIGLLNLVALPPAVGIITRYQPPNMPRQTAAASGAALTERVVLVVLSGVGAVDLAAPGAPWRFVQLRRRAGEGAYGTALAVQPSGDAPAWAALLTGLDPSITGIVDEQKVGPLKVPSLFDYARGAGIRSAMVASRAGWSKRPSPSAADRLDLAPASSTVAARAVADLANQMDKLVVVLLDGARIGTARSDARWTQLDTEVGAIAAALDPGRDTLIVTADHGLLADGSTGGDEDALLAVPLVLWGRGIAPSALGVVDQRAVAPTVSLLLGLPYSPDAGRPLGEALQLAPSARAQALVRLLEARLQPSSVAATSAQAATAARLLAAARSYAGQRDWERAAQAAQSGLLVLVPQASLPWYITSGWVWGGAIPLLLLGLGRLTYHFRHLLRRLLRPCVGVGGYFLAWFMIFYLLAGKRLSLSAIYGEWNRNLAEVGMWSALGLAVVAVGIGFAQAHVNAWIAARELALVALLTLATLAGFVLTYLLIVGLPPAQLPNLTWWTAVLLALAQGAGAGLAAPAAMLFAAMVGEIRERGR